MKMKMIRDFSSLIVGKSVHTVRFGHLFLGKSGVNSTGLCLKENQQ